MAELLIAAGRGHRQRSTPRIDLTPMVDLGFLLITFFMLTTTMSRPKAMDVQMPYTPAKQNTAFYESSAITLMPASDHRIFYYEGRYVPDLQLKEVNSVEALRQLLTQKQKALQQRAKPEERELQVLIKAHNTATVKDIVGLMDEMTILNVRYYALVDIYPEEAAKIASKLMKTEC